MLCSPGRHVEQVLVAWAVVLNRVTVAAVAAAASAMAWLFVAVLTAAVMPAPLGVYVLSPLLVP